MLVKIFGVFFFVCSDAKTQRGCNLGSASTEEGKTRESARAENEPSRDLVT
jgi:hypothetical protein